MKNLMLLVVILLGLQVNAQNKTEKTTLKVFGNCTQCKARIENALDQKGIKMAEWNIKSKELVVVYNPTKISLEKIHELIAKSGHDTEKATAPDSVYSELPGCCLYRENPHTHED